MIVIYAPFPHANGVRNGWTRRIAAIEALFADRDRVYVWPERQAYRGDPLDYRTVAQQVAPRADFLLLDLRFSNHHRKLGRLIADADFVYAHTSHSAQHLLPYYGTGKIVTDLHGIAPEEELMQGHPGRSRYFAELEAIMVRRSARLVVVTEAMMQHLQSKYPGLDTPHIVLPIVDDIDVQTPLRPVRSRPTVVYSGGLQSWQNIDRMLDAVACCRDRYQFMFLTEEKDRLQSRLSARGLDAMATVTSLAPDQLAAAYADADFGFVLRDDSPVNRVSCPTKLSEYLACGVVPVVDLVSLGDFETLCYRYVTLTDFLAGRLPPPAQLHEWRRQNRAVYERIRARWRDGSQQLRQLELNAASGGDDRVASMTSLERSAVYPLHGLQFVLQWDRGTEIVRLNDVVEAEVRCSIELPAMGTLRRVTLQVREMPMIISPAIIEVEDRHGVTRCVDMGGGQTDRFGNWVFEGLDGEVTSVELAIDAPLRLSCRFDIALVGPEVACVIGKGVVRPPPTILQRLWRGFHRSASGRSSGASCNGRPGQ